MTDKEMFDNLVNDLFALTRQSGKSKTVKKFMDNIVKTCPEVFTRMESKRKESLFTDLWNKECVMDIISNFKNIVKMEILSCYYISDGNDNKVVFNISFNEYGKNDNGKGYKFLNSNRCEFNIKFYEKDGKADFIKIFAKLYDEVEDLYENKIVSKKVFSDFVGFDIEKDEKNKQMNSFAEKFKNNTVCGAFGNSDDIRNLNGDKMNTDKEFKDLIKSFFGEEAAEKAVNFAKELKDSMTRAVDEIGKKACESKPSIDEAVEKAKEKTKSVFDKISSEIGEKTKACKGSFNALKETVKKDLLTEKEKTIVGDCVRDFFSKNQTSNLPKMKLDVTLSAIEVFVVNKVEICEQLIQTMEKYKMTNLGRSIELCDLPIDFDNKITVEDSDFVDMLEQFLLVDKWIDEELCLTDLEFITNITLDGVENNSYYIAKTSVGEMMDVYIKFVPVEYSIKS